MKFGKNMSRIGRKTITIPEGVEVKIENRLVEAKGPKGSFSVEIRPEINIELKDNNISLSPKVENKRSGAFWGLSRSLINNLIIGVSQGFEKKLEIQGVGYKANLEGNTLILDVGFSHQVKMEKPEGIDIVIEKNIITISGADKQLVGETAARIRRVRPPEPYKGKGIRYLGEKVRRKLGKKAVAAA